MLDLPRVGWAARKGAPRGPCCGSWRSLVARNPEFSVTVGQSKGQGRNRVDATTCGAVVAFTMGFILVMHCRSGGGFHDVGICLALEAPMVTVLRHKTWSGIAVSAVWQGELVLCVVWDRSNSIIVHCLCHCLGLKKKTAFLRRAQG